MRILISGATGLVGSALTAQAKAGGHQVSRLTRSPKADNDVGWDPAAGQIDAAQLEGHDAVVHLAGESIANGRWTSAKKSRIRDSRVQGTQLLCQTLAQLDSRPTVLVSASAIGFYGDRGDEKLDENSSAGNLFLSEVCQQWESATSPASEVGIRVANARLGVVLSTKGGALAQMLTPFRLGVGGVVGSGNQYMSWISLTDVVSALLHALHHEALVGPVNLVAPNPVTNREFTKALGHALRRPTVLPMPAFAARLVFGQMADELLLASTRVVPDRLLESGFEFTHREIAPALQAILSKTGS